MSDENASSGEGETVSVLTVDAGTPAELTMNGAAKALADMRYKRNQSSAEAPEATAEPELVSQEADADPVTDPGEDPEAEAVDPPIERPKSWAKDEDAEWQSLPRGTQQKIVARELERDKGTQRSQQEAADARKAAQAERETAEQLRKQYEAKLPALEKKLQTVGPFADIQSHEDLRKLQQNDPFRFQEYQLYVWEQQAEQQELRDAEVRKTQERQSKRANYEAEQNKLLVELVPEMADQNKAAALRERAIAMLTDDLGLKNDLLSRWIQDDTGHEILSNAGIQKLIADGLKYRDILKAPKAVIKADLPPVQRPGTSKPAGGVSERDQALDTSLTKTGSLKAAQQLLAARRASQRRAS